MRILSEYIQFKGIKSINMMYLVNIRMNIHFSIQIPKIYHIHIHSNGAYFELFINSNGPF